MHFTDQKVVYEKVIAWQKPVKEGMADVTAALGKIRPTIATSNVPRPQKANAQLMVNQAQDILDAVQKDGS